MHQVDVVIATKNSGHYLHRCLQSVNDQETRPTRVVLIDQSSSDNTREIARMFQGVEIHNQIGEGIPSAWNQGISMTGSEYVALIDSDDHWDRAFLRNCAAALRSDSNAQYAVAKVKFMLESENVPPGFRPELVNAERVGWMPGTTVFRRSVFSQVGMFPEDFKIASDIEWYARLRQLSIPMVEVNAVGLFKLMHGENFSLNNNFSATYRSEILRVARNSIKSSDS